MNTRKLSVSIAMTTYNGAKYLTDQLYSIYVQTYDIDELIICDDGSSDNTEAVVSTFINQKRLENKWHYFKNNENMGPMKNFIHCAKMCAGDIIFYSDQDDIWEKKKVEEMIQVFEDNSNALAVCCGQQYMDKNGKVMSGGGKYIKKGITKQVSFEEQVRTMYSSGLCLAFRRQLLNEIEHLVFDKGATYDISTGLVAAIKGGMYRVEKPLVLRRIHGQNASHPTVALSDRVQNYQLHINGRKLQLIHMELIESEYGNLLTDKDRKHLHSRIVSTKKSVEYLIKHKWWMLLGQILSMNPMDNKKLLLANTVLAFVTKKSC